MFSTPATRQLRGLVLLLVVWGAGGCSVSGMLANAASAPSKVWARDDDPELVRDAIPVMVKLQETILEDVPRHRGLLESLARSVTQYAVAFVVEEADRVNERSVADARELYARARRLLLRAREYGVRGLEVALPGFRAAYDKGTREALGEVLSRARIGDVPLLYWTAAAWGSAVSTSKNDMALVGDLPRIEALMKRALELDERFDEGAVHEFFAVYDTARSEAQGGGAASVRKHLDRALELAQNKKLMPLVNYAENVLVASQDRKEFQRVLQGVVATDVDADPDHRLVNILAQRRARWLLGRTDELFVE